MISISHVKTTAFFASLLTLPLAGALFAAGCGATGRQSAEKMTSFASGGGAGQAELFSVPAEQLSHIQIVTIAPHRLTRTLRMSGQVSYNGFRTTPVISAVGGPVSRVLAYPGQHIRSGETLLEVASPDFSLLRATYLKAKDSLDIATKNYERAQDLYAHHAIAEADLLQAESTKNQAQADLTASEQALRILGVTHLENIAQASPVAEIPVLAPISGEIVDRQCSPGQLLQAGATQCFTISDMSTVWVLVNVYQNELAYVRNGQEVTVQTDAYPTLFRGTISYLSAALDPNTRTLQARIVTENPGEKLKNQMYVTATVTAGTIPNAITVPAAAVLRNSENQPFVYVEAGTPESGPTQFARRMVEVGETQEGQIEILNGLAPGDKVVADGSLFLQFQNSLQQ